MGGCCAARGLALWAAGADSSSCLLGLVKASGEGATETGDGEFGFEEAYTELGGIERATGRGEGVFGAEKGGVRFFEGGGVE